MDKYTAAFTATRFEKNASTSGSSSFRRLGRSSRKTDGRIEREAGRTDTPGLVGPYNGNQTLRVTIFERGVTASCDLSAFPTIIATGKTGRANRKTKRKGLVYEGKDLSLPLPTPPVYHVRTPGTEGDRVDHWRQKVALCESGEASSL